MSCVVLAVCVCWLYSVLGLAPINKTSQHSFVPQHSCLFHCFHHIPRPPLRCAPSFLKWSFRVVLFGKPSALFTCVVLAQRWSCRAGWVAVALRPIFFVRLCEGGLAVRCGGAVFLSEWCGSVTCCYLSLRSFLHCSTLAIRILTTGSYLFLKWSFCGFFSLLFGGLEGFVLYLLYFSKFSDYV